MPSLPAADVKALGETLASALADAAKTTANVDRIIAARAKEIGDRYGVQYARTAREQIEEKDAELAQKDFELRRANDLAQELRRQLRPLEFYVERFNLLAQVVRKAGHAGEPTVSVDALNAILRSPGVPAPTPTNPTGGTSA